MKAWSDKFMVVRRPEMLKVAAALNDTPATATELAARVGMTRHKVIQVMPMLLNRNAARLHIRVDLRYRRVPLYTRRESL
jgi:hypothetical protein